jgi:hypothetical protein
MRKICVSSKTLSIPLFELGRLGEVRADRLLDDEPDLGVARWAEVVLAQASAMTGKNDGAVDR